MAASGRAFSCGEGVDGKLGHGSEESWLYPQPIKSLSLVTAAACGQHHSACVLGDSTLYTFGNGTRGQLGYINSESVASGSSIYPTLGANSYGPWKSTLPKAVSSIGGSSASGGVLEVTLRVCLCVSSRVCGSLRMRMCAATPVGTPVGLRHPSHAPTCACVQRVSLVLRVAPP